MAPSHYGKPNEVYKELWMACAGPLVDVPDDGDYVFYFPQGHIEQFYLKDSTSQEATGLQLPDKILCIVVQTSLTVDPETDQVHAIITLHPLQEPFEMLPYNDHPTSEQPKPTIHWFCKILTNYDTSTCGPLSVPRKHANKCLPPLDLSSQELMVKDLHGNQWCFRHIVKGMPPRHLITGGWHTFVRSKRLVAGDTSIFMRGPNDELRVGIRRLGQPTPATSLSQNKHLEVLASVSHALSANTKFDVCYNPRASPFIVGLNKYLRASPFHFSTGMHVVMRLKDGGYPENEKRHTGVIMEEPDLSSEWGSLKVQWNEPSKSLIQMPKRASPWQVEPAEGASSLECKMFGICGCLSYLCDLIFRRDSIKYDIHRWHVNQRSLQDSEETLIQGGVRK